MGCTNARISAIKLGVQNKGVQCGSVLALAGSVAVSLNGNHLTVISSYKLF